MITIFQSTMLNNNLRIIITYFQNVCEEKLFYKIKNCLLFGFDLIFTLEEVML